MGLSANALVAVAAIVIVAAALVIYPFVKPADLSPVVAFKEMPRFESYDALVAAFEEGREAGRYRGFDMIGGIMPTAMETSTNGAVSKSADFSTTNIQVEGVDEADIVKTDGKYIYNFSGTKLVITDAYPIEGSKIVSKTEFSDLYPIEMFVSEDKLLLFGRGRFSYSEQGVAAEEIMPYPYYGGNSVAVRLYDISDRATPVLEKELSFEGEYLTSRLIGEHAYFVVNSWPVDRPCGTSERCIIPMMEEDNVVKQIAEPVDIGYIPPMPAQSFVTLVSLDLGSKETEKETVAGSAQNVFASQNNIYLAATVWIEPASIVPEGTPIVKDVERIILPATEETAVNKFGLADGKIGYVGQGIVQGHVLNQFSMDEFQGKFRIATTSGQLSRFGSQTQNNLYVLDEEMNTIGKLEDLAPGESIYSARFMGERAYMVTFKKVDPLFVIDVSDPTNPTVLGKLKIPGYSDYLHPIDETHLIGVGKEAIEAAKGDFAWYQGLKMAVFDVSDVENPIEMHKVVIGDRGTESYALRDHKAFLYDREKELLVLPIMLAEIPEEQKKSVEEESMMPSYGEPTFQGAFVFKLTLENGFEERGRITHITEEEELKRGHYFGDEYSVKRALYIGNVLYTLSDKMMKANSLDTLQELKEFYFE